MTDPAQALKDLMAKHTFFVGIDSDGCAFDTMEIKHKECFIPNIVKHWGLQAVSKYAREAAEFVNLYSRWRGINRWPALLMVFDLLNERPEVQARQCSVPTVPPERLLLPVTAAMLSKTVLPETLFGPSALRLEQPILPAMRKLNFMRSILMRPPSCTRERPFMVV